MNLLLNCWLPTILALIYLHISLISASFCGTGAIPYSLEVLQSGVPSLGCARPSCFGHIHGGAQLIGGYDHALFLPLSTGEMDGHYRKTDVNTVHFRHPHASEQLATCTGAFIASSCASSPNSWVGGIAPVYSTSQPLALQCCTYAGMQYANNRQRAAAVKPGQMVVGGEVFGADGRQNAFDFISDIQKVDTADGQSVVYYVTMKRMMCISDPKEPEIEVDARLADSLLQVLDPTGYRRTIVPPIVPPASSFSVDSPSEIRRSPVSRTSSSLPPQMVGDQSSHINYDHKVDAPYQQKPIQQQSYQLQQQYEQQQQPIKYEQPPVLPNIPQLPQLSLQQILEQIPLTFPIIRESLQTIFPGLQQQYPASSLYSNQQYRQHGERPYLFG